MALLSILLGCVASYIVLKYVLRLFWPRVWGLPGPIWGRLSGLYRIWLLSDGRGPIHYAELHRKYGPVVLTGPKHVSISDFAMIPVIYDAKNAFIKSEFYNVFRPLFRGQPMDTVFTTADVAHNKRLKATLVKSLTGSPLILQPEIQKSIDIFVEQMYISQGQSIDLSYWSFYWSFDITFALVFGEFYGYMKTRNDCNRWIYTFKTITGGAAILGQKPEWCSWTLANDSVMSLMRRFQSFPDPTQEFLQEVENRIRSHDASNHECGKTFICKVLADRKDHNDFNEYAEAVNILFETFFAAAAEVAVTLGTVFYCLLKNQTAYDKLVAQLRSTSDGDGNPDINTWRNPYLYAIIKESLRLYSSNSPPMERIVPESGIRVSGHFIPAGTIISVPQYAAHRDPEVYGSDADVFRAERWLEADEQKSRLMDRNFLAFGRGTRACVGRDLASLQLRMLLADTLKNFDIRFANAKVHPKITMFWMLDHVGLDGIFTPVGNT
ncbi:hypothetical protein G7054_g4414 [Neopestalotiopsis clavispora]|nr:hypothetical protein G7054_g4414 [Neopestalotiopsis clavispora]